jgi:uncharacterized protein (TIGR03067 family)
VWQSVVTVKDDSFALSKLLGAKGDLKGTLVFDPADPKAVDLRVAELDLSDIGVPMKIPAGTLRGIYRLDGDRLTVCFPREYERGRPTAFEATADVYKVTLARAPAGFKEFPKEVTLRVTGPGGAPAANATVTGFMYRYEDRNKKDAPPEWKYSEAATTSADGSAKFPLEKVQSPQFVIRDAENKRMAVVPLSPAKLVSGEVKATLAPECRVTGQIVCDDLAKRGEPVGWTNVYVMRDGGRFASCDSPAGTFELVLPPGKYRLWAYGEHVTSKHIDFTVPENRSEHALDPVALPATGLALLKGRPAPEFEGVMGWWGQPVKLADLKGKYVLVEFWGYWCGPCIGAMPVLIELHEKYADKGLVIVGVHMDGRGEVDTAAKLDEKIAGYQKDVWKGKTMPFPSALVSGKRVGEGDDARPGGTIARYGVNSFPTTVLIDPDGKVVGKFHARDIKDASAEIEKLLAGKK